MCKNKKEVINFLKKVIASSAQDMVDRGFSDCIYVSESEKSCWDDFDILRFTQGQIELANEIINKLEGTPDAN